MYCSKCGGILTDNATACETCGAEIRTKHAVTYDYISVEAHGKSVYEVIDSYQALGWEAVSKDSAPVSGLTTINLRRNRKVKNKEQLNRMQVKLDDCFNSIRVCEKNKTQTAMVVALILGIIGSLIFGGGMSLCIAWENPEIWMYITGGVLAVVGAVPCCLSYFVFNTIRAKHTAVMDILIEQKRDEISNLCEDSQKFLL